MMARLLILVLAVLAVAALPASASTCTTYRVHGKCQPPPPPPPPPTSTGALTGAHWGEVSDLPTFKQIGYGFDVMTLNPSDPASWPTLLDAAQTNGQKLIVGAYPEPYSYSNGQWSISAAGVDLLNYLAGRSSQVLALFVFNEPYWTSGYTAAQLRALRLKIRTVWPTAQIYHDLGQPSGWVPTGPYSGGSTNWADQTGVCDYCGVWDYPFETGGYQKTRALATLARETSFVTGSMGGIPVWLNQSHAASCCGLVFPTQAQILDWNCATRSALPAGSLISWYVWRQGIYTDVLANHPEDWSSTTAAACP